MAVERFGNKTDVVVKLVLVFFISLLSFSIGTFVGKKFSDNQHKLSQLEPVSPESKAAGHEATTEDRGVASISPEAHEVKPKDALSDEEISKLAEEFVTDDEAKPATGKTEKHEKPEMAETKRQPAQSHEPSDTAAKVAEGKDPSEESHHAPAAKSADSKPAALPKEVAGSAIGKYTVQIASYSKEEEAQSMASDLKSKGFSSFYVPAEVKGQTWYRVSVGLFTTQKEAQAYRNDLMARAKVSSAMVQKISK